MFFLLPILFMISACSVSADAFPEWEASTFADSPAAYEYDTYEEEDHLLTWESGLGTAGELDGNIVVVSIFLNDDQNSWDFSDPQDVHTRDDCLDYLGIASDWISQSAQQWGKETRFIYDWSEDPQLYYETKIIASVTAYGDDPTEEVSDFIEQSVNTEELRARYEADSVVFMAFVNTPLHKMYPSYTLPYDDESISPCEITYLLTGCNGEEENPATYAHEILHAFGAPDLYKAGRPALNYNIDSQFTEYCEKYYPNEIMLITYDKDTQEPHYDHISNELSHITAYYIGWTDACPEVEEFHLQPSQHVYPQGEYSGR